MLVIVDVHFACKEFSIFDIIHFWGGFILSESESILMISSGSSAFVSFSSLMQRVNSSFSQLMFATSMADWFSTKSDIIHFLEGFILSESESQIKKVVTKVYLAFPP
mgnify:CR=1 FL=1